MEEKIMKKKGADGKITGEEVPRYFTPKKRSVFPKRRKLVKRMIFDQALRSFLSLFRPSSPSPSDSIIESNKKKQNLVFPASG